MSRRTLLVVVSTVAWFASIPVHSAEPVAAGGDAARQFVVECRIIDATSGKVQTQHCPKITVFEHQRASIVNLVQRPFVIAVSSLADKSQQPHIEVLPEGLTIELCCHANDAGSVTLDVTLEQSRIATVDVVELDDQTSVQQPHVEITKGRHFVAAKGGVRFALPLDHQPAGKSKHWAEFVVSEIPGAGP